MYMIMCRARGTGREKRKVSLFQNSLTFARVLHNTPLSSEACLVVCVSRLQIQFQFAIHTKIYQERVWRAQVRFSRGAPLNALDTALVSTVQHTSAGDTMQRREDDASTCHASRARSDSPHSSRLHQRNSCSHYSHCRHVDVKSLLQIQHALVVDATLFTADEHVDPELRAKMCAVALRGIDHLLLDGRNRELALRE